MDAADGTLGHMDAANGTLGHLDKPRNAADDHLDHDVQPTDAATVDMVHIMSAPAPTPLQDEPRQITVITTRLDTRRDLADTGATISATGIRSILHRFQAHSDYEIKGYDGQVTKAAGQGYACIYNPMSKQVDEMLFVYTPMVMGTIISLEHHARKNPRIH